MSNDLNNGPEINPNRIGIKIKTFKTFIQSDYSNKVKFDGQHTLTLFDTISASDLKNDPLKDIENKYLCDFVKRSYGYSKDSRLSQFNLLKEMTSEEKSLIYSIIRDNYLKFQLDEFDKDSVKYKLKHESENYDLDNLTEIADGRYLEIFWIEKNKYGQRYHFAEYQYKNCKWHSVDTSHLSCTRKTENGAGVETIHVPLDQTLYLMISDVLQSSQRIDSILDRIKKSNGKVLCDRIIEIQPLKKVFTQKSSLLAENVFIEDNGIIVAVPDYSFYAETLFNEVEKLYIKHRNEIGENLYDNQNFINTDANLNNKIKYYSQLVCNNSNNWSLLEETQKDRIKNDFFLNIERYVKLEYLAKKLGWWIVQPAYQELLYDYDFYFYFTDRNAKKYNEIIEKNFGRYINIVKIFDQDSMNYLCDDALTQFKIIYQKKNGIILSDEEFLKQYMNSEVEDPKFLLDEVENYNENDNSNWFLETLYPNYLKPAYDVLIEIISCLMENIRYCTQKRSPTGRIEIPRFLRKFILKFGIIVSLDFDNKGKLIRLATEGDFDHIYTLKVAEKAKFNHKIKITGNAAQLMKFLVDACNIAVVIDSLSKAETPYEKACAYLEGSSQLCEITVSKILKGTKYLNNIDAILGVLAILSSSFSSANSFYQGDRTAGTLKAVSTVSMIPALLLSGTGIGIVLFAAGIVTGVVASYFETEDIEKWVKLALYGSSYNDLIKNKRKSDWSYFVNYVIEDDELKVPLTKYERVDKVNELLNKWLNGRTYQLEAYYKIFYSFKIKCTPLKWTTLYQYCNIPYNGFQYHNFPILRIEFNIKSITQKDRFIVSITYMTIGRKNVSEKFEVTGENLNLFYDEKKGYKVVLYLSTKNNLDMQKYLREKMINDFKDIKKTEVCKSLNMIISKSVMNEVYTNKVDPNFWSVSIEVKHYTNVMDSIKLDRPISTCKEIFTANALRNNMIVNEQPRINIGRL